MKRVTTCLFLRIACAAAACIISTPLWATPIAISNYSFEADVQPRDGDTATVANITDDFNTDIIPSSWLGFDDGRGSDGNRGLVSTATDSFFNSSLSVTPDADSNDQTFFTAARDIYQVLPTNLQSNMTYTLTVDIGDRNVDNIGGDPGTPVINFGTGSTPGAAILSPTTTSTPMQIDGGWVTWTFTYTTDTSTAGIDQPLRIELTTGINVGWFDNVRLDVSPTNIDPFYIHIEQGDQGFLFSWSSRSNKVYDLLFDDDQFGEVSSDLWPVYMTNSEMVATPPMNALAVPYPVDDAQGFFVIKERDPEPNNRIKVFLLGGQSNMMGSNTEISDLPPELQVPQTDILFFYGTGSLMYLQPGSGSASAYGPEITFGRTVADTFSNESFALIKHAESATNLKYDWDPATGSSYSAFRNVVADGLSALTDAGYIVEIVGMLWTQGERDVREGYEASYEANLQQFIADIRSRYGENLPFFISQLSSQQTNLPASELALIRQAQANVASADANSHLIVTDTFEMGADNLHFSSAGQIALGQGFADAYEAQTSP